MNDFRSCANYRLGDYITNYPSHGFVIDYTEASELFPNVRQPNPDELLLESHTFNMVREQGSIVDILISTDFFWGKRTDTEDEDEDIENAEDTTDVVGEETESL